ncbi:DNA replication complex GINS protein PSF2 [Madurella mycetomatis]|uniref:DNA replication complex GINS protein PSF2 n=1 Tax=Madurella mycetomatis TaxID=100816 RepID=A0A175VWC6_9PEZI|nr:DNA replication complex GINS protein PSF2 [Madurella mycetomatis]
MALPLPPGLNHAEVAFLAEMEMVTIVPRQRLESIDLLCGQTPPLRPPHRADLPLWLALLLKKQRRANVVPPPWLHPSSLAEIIHRETKEDPSAFSEPPPPPTAADPARPGHARRLPSFPAQQQHHQQQERDAVLSPPFVPSCTADAPAGYLPYHWLEVAEQLLAHAGDDVAGLGASAGEVRSLLRDLVEVRAAKMRSSAAALEGFGGGLMSLRGVGAIELAESRGFVLGVVDGVRKIGAGAEAARREREEEMGGGEGFDGSDEEMGI